jgi:hypothetical protein
MPHNGRYTFTREDCQRGYQQALAKCSQDWNLAAWFLSPTPRVWSAWSVWAEWEGNRESGGISSRSRPRDSAEHWGKLSRKGRLYRFDRETDVAEPITKMDAVRQALAELSVEARSSALQEFVKKRFGLAMTLGHVKNAKGKIVRKARLEGKAGGQKPAKRKPVPQKSAARAVGTKKNTPTKTQAKPSPAPVTKGGGGKEKGIPLNDILYVKKLVGRFGPGQLHTLIDAFAG